MASFSHVSAMMTLVHGSCFPCVSAVARPNHKPITTRRGATTIAANVTIPAEEVDVYDSTAKGSKLAAWTSVRQERWEGAVDVDGHVPHWLVSKINKSELNHGFIMID